MTEDWLQRALKDAASKRRTPYIHRVNLKTEDIAGRPLPLTDWCKVCQHPLDSQGKCVNCQDELFRQAEWKLAAEQMVGGKLNWNRHTEQNFVVTEYNRAAYEAAMAFDPKKQNLFLHGPCGTGKSHLATIIKRRLVFRKWMVKTVSMPNVLDEMIANMKSQRFSDDMISSLVNIPILSIEDVGAGEKPSEFTVRTYFRLIDSRYTADRRGLVVTSNYSLGELADLWRHFDRPGRIASRLKEMCVVRSTIGERDWREEGK